jgi:hypothetical protein
MKALPETDASQLTSDNMTDRHLTDAELATLIGGGVLRELPYNPLCLKDQ